MVLFGNRDITVLESTTGNKGERLSDLRTTPKRSIMITV